MSRWGSQSIKSLALVKGGKRLPKGANYSQEVTKHPYLRVVDFKNNSIDVSNLKYLVDETASQIARYTISSEDVYISIAGTIGLVGTVPPECNQANLTENAAKLVIKAGNLVDKNYLVTYLSSPFGQKQIQSKVITTTQPKLALFRIEELEIPLPPIETQKQIAKTLDTAAELLAMRKQQLGELDNLIKSVFCDMFGDPVTNPMGWEFILLNNYLDRIESGWSPVCEGSPVNDEEEWGICKLSAVTGGHYNENENKAIIKDSEIKPILEVKKEDLLFTRKNTIELVGSCAFVFRSTKKLMIPDTIFRLCTKDNVNKLYLWGLFNCHTFKPFIQRMAGGSSGSMPNISKERLKRLEIPLPPFPLQTKFSEIVIKIEEQKTLVKKAIDETQYLFDSLMSEYFD